MGIMTNVFPSTAEIACRKAIANQIILERDASGFPSEGLFVSQLEDDVRELMSLFPSQLAKAKGKEPFIRVMSSCTTGFVERVYRKKVLTMQARTSNYSNRRTQHVNDDGYSSGVDSPPASPIPCAEDIDMHFDTDGLITQGWLQGANPADATTITTTTTTESFTESPPQHSSAYAPKSQYQHHQVHVPQTDILPNSEATRSGDDQRALSSDAAVGNDQSTADGDSSSKKCTTKKPPVATMRRSTRLAGKQDVQEGSSNEQQGKKRPADADPSSMQGPKKSKK
jgi:hypothetical protein